MTVLKSGNRGGSIPAGRGPKPGTCASAGVNIPCQPSVSARAAHTVKRNRLMVILASGQASGDWRRNAGKPRRVFGEDAIAETGRRRGRLHVRRASNARTQPSRSEEHEQAGFVRQG